MSDVKPLNELEAKAAAAATDAATAVQQEATSVVKHNIVPVAWIVMGLFAALVVAFVVALAKH